MESIYRKALGKEFDRLHPMIQERFGFTSAEGIAAVGTGTMDEIWRGKFFTLPFLYLGAWRSIMFPEHGHNINFTIENYAYRDSFGRETVTWVRTFMLGQRRRRFDATMIYSNQRKRIVDYLGTHQHLAVDLELSVAENGGLRLRSGEQRFYEHMINFRFPLLFSGIAEVCEWYDNATQKFKIDVAVKNRVWGPLFGYRGSFNVEYRQLTEEGVPSHVKPVREEARE